MPQTSIPTTRFGDVSVDESVLVTFPNGIVGFEHLRKFVILEGPEGTPLKWLQSAEEPAVAFVVADPSAIVPDYVVRAHGETLDPLELASSEDAAIAVIITVPGDLARATCNLLAPLVFNVEKRLGAQVILEENYPIRHPLIVRRIAPPADAPAPPAADAGETSC
ncbi:MAG: flagellar assembly protein FliW [Planctomycetes bacterium]|nr:flagellar assembly protein FliW [Planctomycetota bacterium]